MQTLTRICDVEERKKTLLKELEYLLVVEKDLSDPSKVIDMDLADFLPETKNKKRILMVFNQSSVNIKTVRDLINHEYNILRYYGMSKGSVSHISELLKPYRLSLKQPLV